MPKSIKELKAALKQAMRRIGRERDKLRDLADEASSRSEDCQVAVDSLEDAVDSLSKYV